MLYTCNNVINQSYLSKKYSSEPKNKWNTIKFKMLPQKTKTPDGLNVVGVGKIKRRSCTLKKREREDKSVII